LSGGVLEASADGGATWNDMETEILEGVYTGFLLPGSVLEGRRAWTGGSVGPPGRVRVKLESLAGKIAFLRFRWISQGLGDAGAWIIDDLRICRLAGEAGKLAFGELAYACGAKGRVLLADADLVGAGTAKVEVKGSAQASPLEISASEEGPGFFIGEFTIQSEEQEGFVKATHGDSLTATYRDAGGEDGAPGLAEDTADVDCAPPGIHSLRVGGVNFSSLNLLWETNEPTGGRAVHGKSCDSLVHVAEMPGLGTSHAARLAGLDPGSPVFFRVSSTDLAGNESFFPSSAECLDLSLVADCILNDTFDPPSVVWAHAARLGTDEWKIVPFAQSHSPTSSFHSPNRGEAKDAFLISPALDIPAESVLSFWHTYELEDGYDGARVEISADGGSTWADLGPSITEGAYTGFISSPEDGSSMPAWTGNRVGGMALVSISLADHAGTGRRVRFRILCDDSVGTGGWYIDDVSICTLSADTELARFTRGNCNFDSVVNISDAIFLFSHLFRGGLAPVCRRACDCDANDAVNITDGIYLLLHLFQGGPPLPPPNDCSATLGPSNLDCATDSCIAGG
jgi:hypothetical protein